MTSGPHEQLACFDVFEEAFEGAVARAGQQSRHFRIAGNDVRLRFAGRRLADELTPALGHLASDSSEAGLSIGVWDSKSTDSPLPLLARALVDACQHGWFDWLDIRREIKGLNGDRIKAMMHLGPASLSLFDSRRKIGLFWIPDIARIPFWERGSPLLTILSWWLPTVGCQIVHAAALANGDRGVLLTGRGGSGKSTTALACLGSGLDVLGDDYCVVQTRQAPRVHSLYGSAKLKTDADLAKFPELRTAVSNPDRRDDEKVVLLLNGAFTPAVGSEASLAGILTPRVTGRADTRIVPLSRGLALRQLAPSTLFQLPGSGQQSLRTMTELVRSLPVGCLEVGTDLSQIPGVIESFLDHQEGNIGES